MSAQLQSEEDPDQPFDIGDAVVDSDDTDPDTALVINIPGETCAEWDSYVDDDGTEISVADDNPQYDPHSLVVVCLFVEQIEEHYPDWTGNEQLTLSHVSANDLTHYGFPPGRLKPASENPLPDHVEADCDEDDADTPDEQREPPASLQNLADDLRSGATVDVVDAGDEWSVEITKLGIDYEITASGEVRGSGPHTEAFEDKADSFL